MWYSFNDRWDFIRHDDRRRPRKFNRSNAVVLITLALLCVINMNFFTEMVKNFAYASHIPMAVAILAGGICVVLMVIKWVKNNREFDLFLLLALMLCILCAQIGYRMI